MSESQLIQKAMRYLTEHASELVSVERVAMHLELSPDQFQQLVCRWAGTTPKRFFQVFGLDRGKYLLQSADSIRAASDHVVRLEAMSCSEYRQHGRQICIDYGVHSSPFGDLFIAITLRGICRAGFVDFTELDDMLDELRKAWPLSLIRENSQSTGHVLTDLLGKMQRSESGPVSVHVRGTNFQIAVWRALLKIPPGELASYAEVAAAIGSPKAARAVGNAIGANPVALLIPCHRVVQQSGALGGYRWGLTKKRMVQVWEKMHLEIVN
ncbi:MAG: bifunctional helix-turn-helix domain-containing protein/methylated-DNA--[protein]-cysteine S-methyltransferase [Methylophaga sp.]|nr:bifunctional helix-turn-helix domain-containing protein/methylated-DNA--[protein]-cysteine S-methyltransferase [Methylophaga sp.]